MMVFSSYIAKTILTYSVVARRHPSVISVKVPPIATMFVVTRKRASAEVPGSISSFSKMGKNHNLHYRMSYPGVLLK